MTLLIAFQVFQSGQAKMIQVDFFCFSHNFFFFRIFSPHEAETEEEAVDKHPNRKARGLLRTKIESGEGTIPVSNSFGIQTWDGVLQVRRTLRLAFSQKKKNVAYHAMYSQISVKNEEPFSWKLLR